MSLKYFGKTVVSLILILSMLMSSALAYDELAKGSKGDAVVALQERLNELGYSVGTADGDYGGKTVHAVAEFQLNNALSMTGVANIETLDILFSDDAKGKSLISDKNQAIEELLNAAEAGGMNLLSAGYGTNKNPDYIGVVCNRNNNNVLQLMFYVGIGSQLFEANVSDADGDTVAYFCTLMYKYSDCFDMLYCDNINDMLKGINSSIFYKSSLNGAPYYGEDKLIEFLLAFTELAKEYTPSPNLKIPFDFNPVIDDTEENDTPVVKTEFTKEECQALALTYMQEHIRPYLKNPASLQITNVNGVKTGTEYLFTITYTAMNSFGGYTPGTYYCSIDYTTGEVTIGGII